MGRKNAAASKDQLLEEFQSLVSQTEKLLQDSANLAGDKGSALKDELNNSLSSAREMLKQAQDCIHKQGKEAQAATEEFVGKHPWQSLGLATGLGLLLGLLLGRR